MLSLTFTEVVVAHDTTRRSGRVWASALRNRMRLSSTSTSLPRSAISRWRC